MTTFYNRCEQKTSQNAQHIQPRGGLATRAEDHMRLTKNRNLRLQKTIASSTVQKYKNIKCNMVFAVYLEIKEQIIVTRGSHGARCRGTATSPLCSICYSLFQIVGNAILD